MFPGFQCHLQVRVVFTAWQELEEPLQLRRSCVNDQINILAAAWNTVVGAGKGSGKHVRNAGLVQRLGDPAKDFSDVHRSRAGTGPGWNDNRRSSRATSVSGH